MLEQVFDVAGGAGTGDERSVQCFPNTIRNVHCGRRRMGFDRAMVKAVQDAISRARGSFGMLSSS